MDTEVADDGPFDRALQRAFDPGEHTPADVTTVTEVLRHGPLSAVAARDLGSVARDWLDAAAYLRERRVVPTFTVLCALVAAGDGAPAALASRLLAAARGNTAVEEVRHLDPPDDGER